MLAVLVVDDDPAQRGVLVQVVKSLGYTAHEAADGEEALRVTREVPIDIVVSDWNMPRLTGLELCERLKSRDGSPYVILTTALEGGSRLVDGMRAGADDFIRKPIDLDELDVRLLAGSRMVHAMRRLAEANSLLQRESERQFASARADALTGIGNRLALDEELARAEQNARRYGHRCAIAICDVDHFKLYNDRYGHLEGDTALRRVAKAIQETLRTGDTVFRYGGEEFVAVLSEQSVADAAAAMERVRAAVRALAIPHVSISPSGFLTISIGIAALEDGIAECLARADAALYRAKADGRDRVCQAPDRKPAPSVAVDASPRA